MMKLIIFAVLGLFVGVGGGSAFSVMKAKKVYAADVAHKATLVADSLAKAQEEGTKEVTTATAHDSSGPTSDSAVVRPGDAHSADGSGNREIASASHAPSTPTKSEAPAPEHGSAEPSHESPRTASDKPRQSFDRAVSTVESNGNPSMAGATSKPRLPALPAKPITTAAPPPAVTKLAKIFAAMPAKDAAKVMEQLDDHEVQSLLESLNEKQAAAILQNFPSARAAAISKAALRAAMVKP